MTKIEVLFPEFCNLFGDSSNIRYLKKCLPDADFIETAYTEEPFFLTEKPNLIYMGAMTEKQQLLVIRKMLPYRERIKELIKADVPFLVTSNAIEIFGRFIQQEDGSKVKALDIFPFAARQDMMHRFNCLVLGEWNGMEIVGFKTQFTMAYGKTDAYPFIDVKRGVGMNRKTANEGIRCRNFFGTYLVGPFLVLNPLFTKYLINKVMGLDHVSLAFEDVVMAAYERRLQEFKDPKKKVD